MITKQQPTAKNVAIVESHRSPKRMRHFYFAWLNPVVINIEFKCLETGLIIFTQWLQHVTVPGRESLFSTLEGEKKRVFFSCCVVSK